MRRALAVALLATLVLAGCSTPFGTVGKSDPPGDPLGWENGYWYDESLAVTPEDGYNESEREAVVARAMARVEQIRRLEFEETVPVEVISRDEYIDRQGSGNDGANGSARTHELWNNQVWEGLFVVGEGDDFSESSNETVSASIQGYYSPSNDSIVIVSDSATPTIDPRTLIHELVHALQDQQGWLGGRQDTQDRQLAARSVTEGDATYVEARYRRNCRSDWNCLPNPESGGGGGGGSDSINRGLLLTIYAPYGGGSQFVGHVQQREDWDAVNDLYERPPNSTEQMIHPDKYPDEKPVNVTVPDRSSEEWRRFDHDPVADTLGEASIFAMLVSNDAVTAEGAERYRYDAEASAGWGGDSLVPYRDGDGNYGYVWKTVWDTERDAEQFHAAYLDVLSNNNATERDGNVYVIPEESEFGDAFRVVRDGDTVLIVNAPSVDDLDEIHGAD
jgi:hypothetical protein